MKYYWMNKTHGHLVEEDKLYEDAEEFGYDDIIDPCSVEYDNWSLHYAKTNILVN